MYYGYGPYSNWINYADPLWNSPGKRSRESDMFQFTTTGRSSLFSGDLAMDGMFRPRETYQDMLSRQASEWARRTEDMETKMAMQNLLDISFPLRLSNGSGAGNYFAAQSAPQSQMRATESARSSTKKEQPYKFRFDLTPDLMEFDESDVLSRLQFNTGMNLVLPGSDSKHKWYGTVKHCWLHERSAGTLFSCTGIDYQLGYGYKKEKSEWGIHVGSRSAPGMSVQSGGIGIGHVSGNKIELDVFRMHNHPTWEKSTDCAACTIMNLNLDGCTASLKHAWSGNAETKCGVSYDMRSGRFSPFGEHKQKFDIPGGSLGFTVGRPAGGGGFAGTVSWVWNKLTGF